jgi:hypothetical protein
MTVPTPGGWPALTRLSAKVDVVFGGFFTSARRAADFRAAAVCLAPDDFCPLAAFGFAADRLRVAIACLRLLTRTSVGSADLAGGPCSRDGESDGRKRAPQGAPGAMFSGRIEDPDHALPRCTCACERRGYNWITPGLRAKIFGLVAPKIRPLAPTVVLLSERRSLALVRAERDRGPAGFLGLLRLLLFLVASLLTFCHLDIPSLKQDCSIDDQERPAHSIASIRSLLLHQQVPQPGKRRVR